MQGHRVEFCLNFSRRQNGLDFGAEVEAMFVVIVEERFLPDATPPTRFTYLPFGAGPRVCVGAQFAMAEATLVLARLVQAFKIELVDGKPVRPTAVVTTAPDRAVPFRLRSRDA